MGAVEINAVRHDTATYFMSTVPHTRMDGVAAVARAVESND